MRRTRFGLAVGGVLVFAGLLAVAVWSARSPAALSFDITPSQALNDPGLRGRQVRVSGAIVAGSVRRSGDVMTFVVTDGRANVGVTYSGTVPYTFRRTWEVKGWDVVVEGELGRNKSIAARNVFVRHPPDMVKRSPKPADAGAA